MLNWLHLFPLSTYREFTFFISNEMQYITKFWNMIDLSGWTQTLCVFNRINLRASTQRANKMLSDEKSQIASGTVAWFVQAWLVAFEISFRKIILWCGNNDDCVLNMIKLWVQSHLASARGDKMLSWWDIATFSNLMLSPWDKPAVSHKQSLIAELKVQVKSIYWYKYVWKESGWTRTQKMK